MIKEIIKKMRPYMKENGFSIHKSCFYRINDDLAYCVELEKPNSLIYVICYIIPLYVPTEYRYCTYGVRLREYLSTTNISTETYEEWMHQLKQVLQYNVFPVFQNVQTPDVFVKSVDEGLFNYSCYISEVDRYRLRLFTAFYKKEVSIIPNLCIKYKKVLENTTYLTEGVKKKYWAESEKIKNCISMNAREIESLIIDIIKKTKQSCFGCKTEADSN